MQKRALLWIRKLHLEEHPEGGYFVQTYRSKMMVQADGFSGPRHASTAIYYMLVGDQFSAFHRIRSDEVWHHYSGGSLNLYVIRDGILSKTQIGMRGRRQAVVEAGSWVAASLQNKRSYCLVGCTVSPGFDYRDWELGSGRELVRVYPKYRSVIERHTTVL
ncbi:MAG TPA: cupin domain-containing protein [Nitrososphaera sp.]